MKRIFFLYIILSLAICAGIHAQANFWDSPAAYLGQPRVSDTPKIFAHTMLAPDTSFFAFDRCTFSPDGTEFYYCTNKTWFDSKNLKLRLFKYDGKKWNGPAILNENLYAPTFSPKGEFLYFIGGGKGGVSQSIRTDTGWSTPALFLKRNYGLYDFITTASGNQYAASNVRGSINNYNCYDICLVPATGEDSVAQTLGIPLNTPGFDGDFFIAKDESYIVISAKEHPDYECELYISYHKEDNSWTNPKSLGPLINNGLAHRWGEYVTPDNKYLFYSYGHSEKDCALYWVRFDNLLESLRQSNFEPYVKDSIKNQSVSVGHTFTLHVNGNVFYDDDGNNTLSYAALLSDGTALPSWLKFDPATKIFSGRPSATGRYDITLTATDTAKAMASCKFSLKVNR